MQVPKHIKIAYLARALNTVQAAPDRTPSESR